MTLDAPSEIERQQVELGCEMMRWGRLLGRERGRLRGRGDNRREGGILEARRRHVTRADEGHDQDVHLQHVRCGAADAGSGEAHQVPHLLLRP